MPKPSLSIGARAWLARRLSMRVQPWTPLEQFGLPRMDTPEKEKPQEGGS